MANDANGNYFADMSAPPTPDSTVSFAWQLTFEGVVSGHGAPVHTPNRAAQIYTDVDSGIQYSFTSNGWLP